MGIEGKRLLTEEDEYEALREFNAGYEGVRSLEEDLHLSFKICWLPIQSFSRVY